MDKHVTNTTNGIKNAKRNNTLIENKKKKRKKRKIIQLIYTKLEKKCLVAVIQSKKSIVNQI